MNPADDHESAESSALDWPRRAGAGAALLRELERRAERRLRRRRAATAGTLVLLALAGLLWQRTPEPAAAGVAVAAPSVVVRQPGRQILADGSVVELRDEARITADFSGQTRRLVLEEGEAHFQVAKNPDRPFVVEAAGVSVRAVGTAFSVRPAAESVEVIVTEGRVAVGTDSAAQTAMGWASGGEDSDPDSAEGAEAVLVDAGGRATINRRTGVATVSRLAVEQVFGELAWRVPRLEFSGTPLREVVATFNQHNAVRLVLADDSAGNLRLSGIIRADNQDALLALLESTYGLRARAADGVVTLQRGP